MEQFLIAVQNMSRLWRYILSDACAFRKEIITEDISVVVFQKTTLHQSINKAKLARAICCRIRQLGVLHFFRALSSTGSYRTIVAHSVNSPHIEK